MRLAIVLSLLCSVAAYKYVLFTPDMANSQLLFNQRVAESLAKNGHDVTLLLMQMYENRDRKNLTVGHGVKIHLANGSVGIDREELENQQTEFMFEDLQMWDPRMRERMSMMMDMMVHSCEILLKDRELLEWLKKEKFDVAFSHMYNTCPIGLIHKAKIPSWIWLNSGSIMDYVADIVGVPLIPSYVPPMMMASSDQMNFVERTKSFIGHGLMKVMWPRMLPSKETAVFRLAFGDDFPDMIDIARTCPLVFANTNDLYQMARPTLAKVINIGGIGYDFKNAKPLVGEYKTIADSGKPMVIFSFGSVAPAHKMPQKWKDAFVGAFAEFPNVNFIMRYEGDDLNETKPKNLHLSKWLPQADLLKHPNMKALISHGGYNSLQEAITAGVPLITIPLFGDQPKNAMLASSRGWAVNVLKSDISKETIVEALKKIVNDDSYHKNIQRVSEMVRHQPFSPEELIVKWSEFLAEFKTLEVLEPAGQKLNFIQYHSIDVILTLLAIVLFVLYVVYRLLKLVFSLFVKVLQLVGLCNCQKKEKKDKKE